MDDRTQQLLATVRDANAPADFRDHCWHRLSEHDAAIAVAAAFDLLAGEPRIKPSCRLVVDPTDSVRRRWELRVSAAGALLASPLAARVFDELRDELAEDADLAADVLATSVPAAALSDCQLDALRALSHAPAHRAPLGVEAS